MTNHLYYGDNLQILRSYLDLSSVPTPDELAGAARAGERDRGAMPREYLMKRLAGAIWR
jgi:hypothetical protein